MQRGYFGNGKGNFLAKMYFLTAGEDECRAWTIRRGTKAPQAAGKIHTDFEKGFIRAEPIAYDKLMEVGGSLAAAKEKGFLRSEGKEYIVQDGDIILMHDYYDTSVIAALEVIDALQGEGFQFVTVEELLFD